MGKIQEFEITFNSNKTVYSPGESLTGTLKISIAQPIQCKAIKVNCQGFCGVTSKSNDTDWTEEEQYFSSSVSIADKGTLKDGEHTFPFKFLLPAAAPTSFEGPYGRIIYRVRAFIDTPRFAKDYKIEKPFSMKNTVNLNEIPGIQDPSSSSVTKNFSYMLVKNGTVVLKAKSDMRGYIAGQIIKVFAEIENKSDKSTGHVVASLMQKVTYNTKKPTYDLRTVAEVEGPGIKGGQKNEWKEQIIVPSLHLSTLTDGNLIQICYYIQVYLKYPEASLTLPIYIGSTALDPARPSSSRQVPPMPAPRNNPTSAPTPDPSPAAAPAAAAAAPAAPAESAPPSLPPRTPPKPAPKPRPRSTYASPSAPPADLYPELPGVANYSGEMAKSTQHESGSQVPVSPNAFSYAPGLSFRQKQSSNGPSAPSATAPQERNATSSSASLPPNYRSSPYPHEAPPSYEDSCNI
ncbi:arrestin domain-containing protein 1a [Puntigrus tetrazona]|uniref:arrestin domain-containing protein 1a n=1 Tax=Puntigrus tetrazona TaxID=1606681 RepID=UPI001C89B540|nr:arrestin domain-containing protein 1a [Puntigrus tetrazona]